MLTESRGVMVPCYMATSHSHEASEGFVAIFYQWIQEISQFLFSFSAWLPYNPKIQTLPGSSRRQYGGYTWNHANSGSVIWRLVDVPQKSTKSKKLIKVCKRYSTRVHQNQTLHPPNAHGAEILAPTFSPFRHVVTEFNPWGSTLVVPLPVPEVLAPSSFF